MTLIFLSLETVHVAPKNRSNGGFRLSFSSKTINVHKSWKRYHLHRLIPMNSSQWKNLFQIKERSSKDIFNLRDDFDEWIFVPG